MTGRLPDFGLDAYTQLLDRLAFAGYHFQPVSALRSPAGSPTIYLRHDLDSFVDLVTDLARLEHARGLQATYFVPLAQPFNCFFPPVRAALAGLRQLGHEIGLHYDLTTYPRDPLQRRQHLDWEASLLAQLVEGKVETIAQHQPDQSLPDPFRSLDEYIHPHDPRFQAGLVYVSDSCRAWRDEKLLDCFGPLPPLRLLLNTHPENWLDGSFTDRIQYLEQVLLADVLQPVRKFYLNTVRQTWLSHPATRQHDARLLCDSHSAPGAVEAPGL